MGIGYGEWLLGSAVSGECGGIGPQLGRGPAETMGHYRSPVVNKSAGHNPLHRVAPARKLAGLSLIRMRSQVQVLAGPPQALDQRKRWSSSSPGPCRENALRMKNASL